MIFPTLEEHLQNDLFCVEWDIKPKTLSKLPSVLWCCRLGGRKGIRSVKKYREMVEVSTG